MVLPISETDTNGLWNAVCFMDKQLRTQIRQQNRQTVRTNVGGQIQLNAAVLIVFYRISPERTKNCSMTPTDRLRREPQAIRQHVEPHGTGLSAAKN